MTLVKLRFLLVLLAAHGALAQSCDQLFHSGTGGGTGGGTEGKVHSDFCREWLELHPCRSQQVKPCSPFTFGNLAGTAQTLATGQPVHVAFGSIAPQNGFGAGLAFVEHKNYANEWRTSIDVDAIATGNGSWRAGAYYKAFRLGSVAGPKPIGVVYGAAPKQRETFFRVAPVLNFYAQTTSLNRLFYYGLGTNTLPSGQTAFAFRETVAGANAIVPLGRWGTSLYGEINGRVPQVRGDHHESVPSIEQVYTEATAPGLTAQHAFLEPGVGLRIQPELLKQSVRLHYLLEAQSFTALGSTAYSFRRWTADFGHEFPLDSKVHLKAPDDHNGPDSCAPAGERCPSPTRVSSAFNKEGSITLRLLMSGSAAEKGSAVPFYFDPTFGGSDIDGTPALASYPDYRFRGPNLLLFRETFEHSIPRAPLGVYFGVDQGKVALRRNEINFNGLHRSYTVGLTVHAGGLPVVYLLFAWGGQEGTHTSFSVSNQLLGGSARPSLF
jgi:hypothetical protein